MLDMDLGSGECGGYAVVALRGELDVIDAGGDMLLAAPHQMVRQGASRQAVVPIRRQPIRMR
jgi:hypothetical protein